MFKIDSTANRINPLEVKRFADLAVRIEDFGTVEGWSSWSLWFQK